MKKQEFCIMSEYNERFNGLERHEIFFGKNRTKSIEDGLVVFITPEQHRGTNGVHGKNGKEFDLILKRLGQMIWQEYYNKTIEDFINRYGRNYL